MGDRRDGGHIRIIGHVNLSRNLRRHHVSRLPLGNIELVEYHRKLPWSRRKIIHQKRCMKCPLPIFSWPIFYCINVWCRISINKLGKKEEMSAFKFGGSTASLAGGAPLPPPLQIRTPTFLLVLSCVAGQPVTPMVQAHAAIFQM